MTTFGALDARARGLGTRLFGRETLAQLARAPSLDSFAQSLASASHGELPGETAASAAAIELAARRVAASRVAVLARWSADHDDVLAPLLEDEDRRAVRAAVRGAVAGVPTEARLAGLIPTPSLPERALAELVSQASPARVAALLVGWAHPYGAAILAEARRERPDLFALERALDRSWAVRARTTAPHGAPALMAYVALAIDLANSWTALLAPRGDARNVSFFLEGGRRLSRAAFAQAIAAPDGRAAARLLAAAFDGTPMGEALARGESATAGLESAALTLQLREQHALAREDPLGLAPTLHYLLRLRAEHDDLCRLAWGITLGVPRATLVDELVST